ncbi:hypothetical protein H1235_14220 [Pseudoxanthomonas sp. NC8]|nr:hypothetical protein H1235_14220 [Pseudoxanthomonas sp. NC8]
MRKRDRADARKKKTTCFPRRIETRRPVVDPMAGTRVRPAAALAAGAADDDGKKSRVGVDSEKNRD